MEDKRKVGTNPTWETARAVGISLVAVVTDTPGPMAAHQTIGVGRACARVDTLLVCTGEVLRTLLVHGALRPPAHLVRVAQVAGGTVAAGPVVPGLAQRLRPALLELARVLTLSPDACLGQRTFEIAVAAGYNRQGKKHALGNMTRKKTVL